MQNKPEKVREKNTAKQTKIKSKTIKEKEQQLLLANTSTHQTVGWTGGRCLWGHECGGWEVGGESQTPVLSSLSCIKLDVGKRKSNQEQNRQLLLSGCLKRELPW